MKRISLLFLLVLPLLQSCKKADDNQDPQDGAFIISGVRDVDLSVSSTGSYTFPITVTSTSGLKDTVSLTTDLTPGGVYSSFTPRTGVTPFTSQVTISTDYSTGGGTFPFKIKGIDKSGTRSYDIKVTLAAYRGWQLGSEIFQRESVSTVSGTSSTYSSIIVNAPNGAQLRISFAAGVALPKINSQYKITGDTGKNNIQLAITNGAHIWGATGKSTDGSEGALAGIFTFDTLKRFTFKCANVEMSDGLNRAPLNCSFSQ